MQNGKRKRQQRPSEGAERSSQPDGSAAKVLHGGYDAKMVEHVRMVTSMIEGRKVSRQEILRMLAEEEMRQHSIGGGGKSEYLAPDPKKDSS